MYVEENSKKTNNVLLFSLMLIVIWKPTPTILFGESLGYKFGDILLLITIISILVRIKNIINPMNLNYIFLVIFIFVEIFSLFFSSLRLPVILDDLFELFRPVLYLLIYLTVYSLVNNSTFHKDSIRRVYIALFIFFVISVFQLFNFLGTKNIMSFFYEVSKSRTFDTSESIWRLASTFTNPNYFSFFLAITLSFFFSGILASENIKEKVWNLIFSIVVLSLVLFTGSRTGLVASIISVLGIYFVYTFKTYRKSTIYKFISIVTFFTLMIFITFYSQDFLNRFERFSDVENIKFNLYVRYEIWFEALDKWKQSPLIGNGPYKYYMDTFDSNYVLMLYRYGLIGLTLFIVLFLFNILKSIKNANTKFSLGMVGVNIVFMISMISAISFNFIQLGAIYIGLVAVQDKIIYLNERGKNNIGYKN